MADEKRNTTGRKANGRSDEALWGALAPDGRLGPVPSGKLGCDGCQAFPCQMQGMMMNELMDEQLHWTMNMELSSRLGKEGARDLGQFLKSLEATMARSPKEARSLGPPPLSTTCSRPSWHLRVVGRVA